MKKKSYLTRAVLAMVASGMLYANVGFADSSFTLNGGTPVTYVTGQGSVVFKQKIEEAYLQRLAQTTPSTYVVNVNDDLIDLWGSYPTGYYICAADTTDSNNSSNNNTMVIDVGSSGRVWNIAASVNNEKSANNNNVTVSGSGKYYVVFSAYSYTGGAANNTLTLNGGTLQYLNSTNMGWAVAGQTDSGNVHDNILKSSVGSTTKVENAAAAGFSYTGDVYSNKSEINDGTFGNVAGGAATEGKVSNNSVQIKGGSIGSSDGVPFIYIPSGQYAAMYKGYGAYGGFGGLGLVTANSIVVSSGSVYDAVGGYSVYGSASNNEAKITGGSVTDLIGGKVERGNGIVESNSVTVAGGTVQYVYGGIGMGSGNVTGNKVSITAGTVTGVVGGGISYGTGKVDSNSVELTNVTMDLDSKSHTQMFAGYTQSGDVTSNTTTLTNVNMHNYDVTGGASCVITGEEESYADLDFRGVAKNNAVTLNSGVVKSGHLMGGLGSTATGNQVTVKGGTYGSIEAAAGYTITDNKVVIQGGTFDAHDKERIITGGGVAKNGIEGRNNGVEISGGVLNGKTDKITTIAGTVAEKGDVKNNYVNITGGTFNFENEQTEALRIFGAKTNKGDATGNSVKVTPSSSYTIMTNNVVYGGYSENGNASDNNVTVEKCNMGASGGAKVSFFGAFSIKGNLTNNSVALKNMTVYAKDVIGAELFGKGDVKGNIVSLNDVVFEVGSVKGGGTYGTGIVSGNKVIANNSTIAEGVSGGKSNGSSGEVSGNSVELTSTKVSGYIYGGKVETTSKNSTAKVSNNSVVINSTKDAQKTDTARISGGIRGGYGEKGDVANNSITLNGGYYSYTAKGIWAGEGEGKVAGNTLNMNGGIYFSPSLYGAYTDEGYVDSNSVNIKKSLDGHEATIYRGADIRGGDVKLVSGGDATNNSVNISGAVIGVSGASEEGSATVNIIGGRTAGGSANGNSVIVEGTTLYNAEDSGEIVGGYVKSIFNSSTTTAVVLGSANNNKVTMTDVTVNSDGQETPSYADVYGGFIGLNEYTESDMTHRTVLAQYYTTGGASNNIVEIVTAKSAVLDDVTGGATFQGEASHNKVTLSGKGIVIIDDVKGGEASIDKAETVVNSNYNELYLTNITVHDDVTGGDGDGDGSTASYNKIYIVGGTYANDYALPGSGYQKHDGTITGGDADGDTIGNIVSIKDATISVKAIKGGDSDSGNIKDNQVIIDGVIFDAKREVTTGVYEGTTIYGGQWDKEESQSFVKPEGKVRENNSLNVGSKGFKINTDKLVTIRNFDSMTFADGATVTNNGTLTFTNNGVKDAGEGDVEVIWSAKIAGTGKLVVNEGDFTVDNVVSNAGGIEINEGGKFRVKNADDIQTSVVNKNNMNLYSGTLTQTVDNTNGTIKIHGVVGLTQKVSGGLIEIKEDGSTLDLQNGTADKLIINELVAYNYYGDEKPRYKDTVNKISFDAGTTVVDQISASSYKGTITLGAVGLKDDFEGEVGDVVGTYQLFTGSSDYSQFTINGSAEAVMGAYKYVFSDNGTNDGKLKIVKDWGYTLNEIINNKTVSGKEAGTVTSYSLNADKNETEGLGTLTRVSGASSRELTINGNSHRLTAPTGITVNSGDTLILKDITYCVKNGNAVSGNGSTKIVGTVYIGNKVENVMTVVDAGVLEITAANIGNTVNNSGTVKLGEGTLLQTIAGGEVVTTGEVTAVANKFDKVNISHEKTLTLKDGTLNSNVSGSGETIIDGNVTVAKGVTLKGLQAASSSDNIVGKGVYVNQGKTLTVKGTIDGYVDNGGTLNFTDGSTLVGYVETVKSNDAESIINLTGNVSITTKDGLCDGKNLTLVGKQVNITNATVTDSKNTDYIKYATATIDNSTVTSNIAGLAKRNDNFSSTGNSITVTNSTVNGTVFGGLTGQAGTDAKKVTANNNQVNISGSTVQDVYGAKAESASEITGNTVSLTNSVVKGNIYGGYTGSSNVNKAYSNTVELDKVTITTGTHYVYASTNNQQTKGGLVNIKSQGLVNKGTTTLGGGKVQIDGNITGTGDLIIKSGTGENNAEITQNSLTNEQVLTTAMDKVHVTTFTNNGTLNASGTLAYAVAGEGTNKVLTGDELTFATGASLANLAVDGQLNVNGVVNAVTDLTLGATGVLNLNNSNKYETLTLNKFVSANGAKVNFDANFAAAGDQITATTASGKLALGSISMAADYAGEIGTEKTYTLLTGNATAVELQGTAETVLGQYKYVFAKGTTAGTLKVTKDNGYTLHQVINNETAYGKQAGTVTNYSLNADKAETEGLGTLTRVSGASSRELTINGNSHKLTAPTGITVNDGDILTLKDITYSVTTGDAVKGDGSTEFAGTVNMNSKVSTVMDVLSGAVLNIKAENIGNTVVNAGTINLAGGVLNKAVVGNGTLNVNDDATFNTKVDNAIVVAEDKTLTVAAGNIGGKVTNNGEILLGAGTLVKQITGGNVTTTGSVTTTADMLNNIVHLDNSAVLTLTNGTINSVINGIGSVNIAGTVTFDKQVNNDIVVLQSAELTVNDAGYIGNPMVMIDTNLDEDTEVILKTGTLGQTITGHGVVKTEGNVDITTKVSVDEIHVNGGTLTANADNLNAVVYINQDALNVSGGAFAYDVKGTGTLNVNGSVTANGNLTAGTVTVADSKALTVNGNLAVGTITINNATLTLAENKNLSVATALTMNGSGTRVTVDQKNVLNADLSVIAGMDTKIVGTAGELVLRMDGVEYTATQHKIAKDALFTTGENAKLTFKGAKLIIDEETEQLTTGGTTVVTGNDMTISGAEPTVVSKEEATKGQVIEPVGAQADKTVTVAKNGESTAAKVDTIKLDGNSNLTAKDLLVGGVATAGNVLKITVDGNSQLSLVGGDKGLVKTEQNVVVSDMDVKKNSTLNLGDSEGKAAGVVAEINELTVSGNVNVNNIGLKVDSLVMNGGHIVFDPNYYQVNKLNFTSGGDLAVVTDGTVLAVGQVMDEGGMKDITAQELKKALDSAGITTTATANGGYSVSDGKAVLAVMDAPIDLTTTGSYLAVDAGTAEMTKALQLGDGAVLVARKAFAEKDIPTVKVNSAADVTISDKAELVIEAEKYTDADGKFVSYTVLGDGTNVYDTLWTVDENIYAADPTYTFHLVDGKLTADWNKVEGIFGENAIAAPDMYNRILQKAQGTDVNAFLKKVITETAGAGSTAATKAVGANALNAATSMGELAAVQHGAVSMANQMGDTLSENLGLAARPITDEKYEKKIWASYVNNKETVEDLALAKVNADYTAKYRGASVGADLWSSEKAVGGLAITYSKGDVNGHNGGVTTNNDAKYYGVSVYNRINVGNDSALLYDFDYLNTKNEISQHNFGTNITADAKVDVLSAGVRYEKGITTGKSVLAPFVGLRYLHLNNKEYTNSLNMHFSADKQNVFQPSVGLNWHGEFQAPNSVWTYRPYIETGYVWNMGNRDCNQVVSFDGAPNTLAYDVVDSGSYFAKLGMNFEVKNFGFGFGYKYQKGSTAKISKWNVDLSWKF